MDASRFMAHAEAGEGAAVIPGAKASLLTIRPGFYMETVHEADGSTVHSLTIETAEALVLSSNPDRISDDGVQFVPSSANLTVRGDDVTILEGLFAPGRQVSIFARVLRTIAPSSSLHDFLKAQRLPEDKIQGDCSVKDAFIFVQGLPGADGAATDQTRAPRQATSDAPSRPYVTDDASLAALRAKGDPAVVGAKGKPGDAGSPGGTIELSIGRFVPDPTAGASQRLLLDASGGKGGKSGQGQKGPKGDTGIIGAGADANEGDGFKWDEEFAAAKIAARGGDGGPGGLGGEGGDPGSGGACGAISITSCASASLGADADAVYCRVTGGLVGTTAGTGGAAGDPGDPGLPGGITQVEHFQVQGWSRSTRIVMKDDNGDYVRGNPGSLGQPGVAGTAATPATATPAAPKPPMITVGAEPEAMAAATTARHLRMLVDEARMEYLLVGNVPTDKDMVDVRDLLGWLQGILDDKTAPPASPNGRPVDGFGDDLPGLYPMLLDGVVAMMRQADAGRNYFGRDPDYVPLLSLDSYVSTASKALENLKSIEDAYKAYFDAARQTEEKRGDVKTALGDVAAHIDLLTGRRDRLAASLGDTAAKIAAEGATMVLARELVKPELDNFKDVIAQKVNALSVSDVLEALAGLAFSESPFNEAGSLTPLGAFKSASLVTGQIGKLFDTAVTKVKDDSGTVIDRTLVVNEIAVAERDVDNVADGLKQLHDGTLLDGNASLLLTTRQQVDDLCEQFWKTGGDAAKLAKQAMDAYADSVGRRSALVIDYNAAVVEMIATQSAIDAANHQHDVLTGGVATADPGTPASAGFMTTLYEHAKAYCIELIYLMSRAYAFWALDDYEPFAKLLVTQPDEIDHALLSNLNTDLQAAVQTRKESLGREPETFPQAGKRGIVVPLDASDLKRPLTGHPDERYAEFDLSDLYATRSSSVAETPFVEKANVRVTGVRAWLPGAKTDSDRLLVLVTHLGDETLITETSVKFSAYHVDTEVHATFTVTAGAKEFDESAIIEPGQIRRVDPNGTIADDYAAIGPFATWRIRCDPKDHVNLDLSGVTSILLEFRGTHQDFEGT